MKSLRRSRFLTVLALALATFLCLPPAPAHAATTAPFDLLASATQTGTGNGGGISVAGVDEIIVFATCTASNTPTQLDVYLQSTSDNGVTWYDLTAEVVQTTNTAATETAAVANKRDVLDAVTSCASAVKAIGKYRNFGSQVRVAWVITGTSFTFSVKAIGKY